MSSCTSVQNLISLLIEEKLSDTDRQVVLDHVDECKSCQRDLADSRYIKSLVDAGLAIPDPPTNFAEKILRLVAKK